MNSIGYIVNTAGSDKPHRARILTLFADTPGAYTPRTRWSALAAIIAAFVIFMAASFLAVIPGEVYARSVGLSFSEARGLPGAHDARAQIFHLLLLGASQLGIAVFVWIAAGFFGSVRSGTLALGPPAQGPRVYAESLALVLLAIGAYSLAIFAIDPGLLLPDLRPFSALMRSETWWLTLLVVGVGAPVSEELLFRGFLFSAVAKSPLGLLGASVLTSALWTALHTDYATAAIVEVFGI